MTLAEDILSKRELLVFIGVENHSTSYHPCLFNQIWDIPDMIISKDLLIIPIHGLGKPYKVSKNQISCYGRSLWLLFVESSTLTHYAFLFDSFAQTDENSFFSETQIRFLTQGNCRTVVVCDIGVYKSRSLVNILNSALSSLVVSNISVCLATILGYNSRGYTDIETDDEHIVYTKDFYLRMEVEVPVINDSFRFLQIERKFHEYDLFQICSFTKNPAETKLQELKKEAMAFERDLKPLWDLGFIKKFIETLNKGDAFDFNSLETKLEKMGFKGNLIDSQWDVIYEKLCRNIRESKNNDRSDHVQKLIKAIGDNINSTINYIKSI